MRILQKSRPILVIAVLAALVFLVGANGLQQAGKANFDRTYPDFIKDNETVLRRLRQQPPSESRDQVIKGVEDNLAWAAEYKRLGFDPEIYEEIEFQKELAKQSKEKALFE